MRRPPGRYSFAGEDVHARGARDACGASCRWSSRTLPARSTPRRIGDSVAEPLIGSSGSKRRDAAALEMLERVGLEARLQDRFPHQLSGGQQQRACIARALVADPSLVVLDEALSSLDVSCRPRYDASHDLQDQFGCAYLFITHDLATAFS